MMMMMIAKVLGANPTGVSDILFKIVSFNSGVKVRSYSCWFQSVQREHTQIRNLNRFWVYAASTLMIIALAILIM